MRFWISICPLLLFYGCGVQESVERVLRPRPDWEALDRFQGSIAREDFEKAMDEVYAPKADWRKWIGVDDQGVSIVRGNEKEPLYIRFGREQGSSARAKFSTLDGLRIAIDPGHLGGEWGKVEHRSFSIQGGPLVQEGDLTLATARRLEKRLRELGAEVLLLRDLPGPVTGLRPEDFREEVVSRFPGESSDMLEAKRVSLANRLFYRSAEIRARADRREKEGGADLAIVLHINASSEPNELSPKLYYKNDAHILLNGCYMENELKRDNQRCEMLLRLFKGYHLSELEFGKEMAVAMRDATGLSAYTYHGDNASLAGAEGYLWSRNLMAGRIYDCPVLYLEPWRANSPEVYEWAGAGDYEGEREFDGEMKASLPAVYSEFVVSGLVQAMAVDR